MVLPGGTAVITDAGRTGSRNSVGGTEIASRIQEYLTGIPDWTKEAWDKPEIQGVCLDIDSHGRSLSIERIQWPAPEPPEKDREAGAGEERHD
jgi:calcineurin-like phosphoesterase